MNTNDACIVFCSSLHPKRSSSINVNAVFLILEENKNDLPASYMCKRERMTMLFYGYFFLLSFLYIVNVRMLGHAYILKRKHEQRTKKEEEQNIALRD